MRQHYWIFMTKYANLSYVWNYPVFYMIKVYVLSVYMEPVLGDVRISNNSSIIFARVGSLDYTPTYPCHHPLLFKEKTSWIFIFRNYYTKPMHICISSIPKLQSSLYTIIFIHIKMLIQDPCIYASAQYQNYNHHLIQSSIYT